MPTLPATPRSTLFSPIHQDITHSVVGTVEETTPFCPGRVTNVATLAQSAGLMALAVAPRPVLDPAATGFLIATPSSFKKQLLKNFSFVKVAKPAEIIICRKHIDCRG